MSDITSEPEVTKLETISHLGIGMGLSEGPDAVIHVVEFSDEYGIVHHGILAESVQDGEVVAARLIAQFYDDVPFEVAVTTLASATMMTILGASATAKAVLLPEEEPKLIVPDNKIVVPSMEAN